jgi:nucleoid-associated protein YgaU
MASRYTYSKIQTEKDTKKRYLGSVIYPKINPTDNDMYIISESSDRLDLLAHKYYGDKSLWWVIAVANNLNNASLYIGEGVQLRIPSNLSQILNDLEKINR